MISCDCRQIRRFSRRIEIDEALDMKLRFSWFPFRERWLPTCDDGSANEAHYICGLLTDDGGCGIDHLLNWMSEGKIRCESVLGGRSDSLDFDCECWTAHIGKENTIIYPAFSDTEDGHPIKTTIFLAALTDWIEFLRLTKDAPIKESLATTRNYE